MNLGDTSMLRFGIVLLCLSTIPIAFAFLAFICGLFGFVEMAGVSMDLAWLGTLLSPFLLVAGIVFVVLGARRSQRSRPGA
jgi:hypothetical protein